jgi:hypothetical protein
VGLEPGIFSSGGGLDDHYAAPPGLVIEIFVLEQICLRWSCKYFARKSIVKSLLISILDKVIYYIRTFLQGSTKPHFTKIQNTK